MPSKVCSTVGGMLAIVGLSAIVGAAHSMFEPVQLTLKPMTQPEPETSENVAGQQEGDTAAGGQDETTPIGVATMQDPPQPEPESPGYEIDLATAKAHFDNFDLFLDARTLYEYENGHIPGALWMPSSRIDDNGALIFEIEAEAGGFDQPVVIYCGGGDCDASHNLAIRLQQGGFTNFKILVEGYPVWTEAGYEVEVGAPLEVEP